MQAAVLFDDKEGGRSIECGGECTPHCDKNDTVHFLGRAKNSDQKHYNALS
jgi:hypothetical protein